MAKLLAQKERRNSNASKARVITKPPGKIRKISNASSQASPITTDNGWTHIDQRASRNTESSSGSSPYMLSNVP